MKRAVIMKTDLFDFDLPESAIALRPAVPRDKARLLQVRDGQVSDHSVSDLPALLRRGDVLVFNDTRVFPAALKGLRAARPHGGGGDVTLDVNLLSKVKSSEVELSEVQTSESKTSLWQAFARPAKRLRVNDILTFSENLTAKVLIKKEGGEVQLAFSLTGGALFEEFDRIGSPPLPPYIARKRAPDEQDKIDYQTVYSKHKGSVAAPTAGLHFTPDLLAQLESKGVECQNLTLHVGAGTFLPVKTDETDAHIMHKEWYNISNETAQALSHAKASGRRIIAVGTTALRALESAYQEGAFQTLSGDTDIFITPGYRFRVVDGLMTNFHLPKSTLFMLVSALAGLNTMQSAYAHAIKIGYRFYSYGDSSLLWGRKRVSLNDT